MWHSLRFEQNLHFYPEGEQYFYATIIEVLIHTLAVCTWRPFVRFLQCRHYFLLSSVLHILRQKFLYLSYECLRVVKRIECNRLCFSLWRYTGHAISFIIQYLEDILTTVREVLMIV